MSSYATDAHGVIDFTDTNGTVLFNRDAGVSVSGWSQRPEMVGIFKNVNETTGYAQEAQPSIGG